MKRLIIYIVCSAGIVLSGCASKEQTRTYVETGTESVNQISKSIIGAKRAELAGDPEILDAYEKNLDDVIAQQRSVFAKLKEEIEEEKRQREAIVSALASLAIETIPAGSSVLKVAKALGGKIDKTAEDALTAANAETEKVKVTANDNKVEIGALTKTILGIAKDTENLEGRADKMKEDIAKLLDEKNAVKVDFAVAQERFNALSTTMQEKLSEVPESVIADLTKLKADDEAFREQFQREVQLTDAEMESLKGMSTEQLLSLLAAAGVAAGAGGALGKTGKSRGYREIDKLRESLTELKREIK